MRCPWIALLYSVLALSPLTTATLGQQLVNESARDIPIAYDVDVVVVGGSTGAVAAAVSAAEAGASVFLAAPHPYLGDDMTATLRMWLEPGEVPTSELGKRLFDDPTISAANPNRLPFTYQADTAPSPKHKDFDPPSRLSDGKWSNVSKDSVQFDESVNITADLGSVEEIHGVRLIVFRRIGAEPTENDFDTGKTIVSVSDDGQSWRELGPAVDAMAASRLARLTLETETTARYVRLAVDVAEGYQRMLLGELEVLGPELPRDDSLIPAPRPMHVKKVLDDVLLENNIQYLYSCMPTDVLRDADGNLAGIVMANRAGRQAVLAKTIIDATPRGTVARMAGARLLAIKSGSRTFRRTVVGGQPVEHPDLKCRTIDPPYQGLYANQNTESDQSGYQVHEYTMTVQTDGDDYAAYMELDQKFRTLTYDPDQQFTSDVLLEVPSDQLGNLSPGSHRVSPRQLDSRKPAHIPYLYVLNGFESVFDQLARPLALIDLGTRLGKSVGASARLRPDLTGVHLADKATDTRQLRGDVREVLTGVRPTEETETIPQAARAIPVLGRYDVVVIGGGTAGAPAGIGAARRGAKTLVVEYLHGLGGVGTVGAIAGYYWGNRVGFTSTVLDGATRWDIEPKMEWYRQELLKAGGDLWFGTIGCGAYVQDDKVIGAVVVTPYGRGVVLADKVIDATGNSDVAFAAGAECIYTDASEFGMQGTGLPGVRLGAAYNNTDFTLVDETDMVDVWQMMVYSKEKYPDAFDHGRLIDTRERRRIVGDTSVCLTDQMNERTYEDSVVHAWSNFDTHGYTTDPYCLIEHPEKVGIGVYIPYRAMLPKDLHGMLVIGLGISAHRDAVPLIRMQPDIQNGGYAAGVAAAMCVQEGRTLRKIDLKALQRHLVEIGNLPENVLTDRDSYPLSIERIAVAVETLPDGQGASIIMSHPEQAMPFLESSYYDAKDEARLTYAKTLAVLGDDLGLDDLIAEVEKSPEWDAGWNYRGMGQFGAALSPLDNLIVAMGRSGSADALPVILEKVEQLDATLDFSHHRAVGLALETIGDRRAAAPLADLLAKPDMTGHVHHDIHAAKEKGVPGGTNAEITRRESLRELLLARALYRCGDHDGLGERILRQYTTDLRGHLARHAKAVLEE